MNPEDIKNIIDTLIRTGELLAVKGYELALRKAYFYAGWDIVGVILVLIAMTIALLFLRIGLKDKNRDLKELQKTYDSINLRYNNYHEIKSLKDDIEASIFSGVLIAISFSGLALFFAYKASYWLVNPELGAIQILVDTLRSTIR